MLSRRNIRIKVMQSLYAAGRDKALKIEQIHDAYMVSVDNSFQLYLFHLYSFLEFLKVSREDATKRLAKHLPTEEDKAFTPKVFENPHIDSLSNSTALQAMFAKHDFESVLDKDVLRKAYKDYSESEEYSEWIMSKTSSDEELKAILLHAYKFLAKNEVFVDQVEAIFPLWIDDKSLILGTMKKTLKALPAEPDFYTIYFPQDETVKDFGLKLLDRVLKEDADLIKIIEPILENWDVNRVAVLDMVLLKMAICELQYFDTIPTKVTLNEFVELAKTYSTDKSKEFINGILDKLMKTLSKEGKIAKSGRGLA